MEELRQMIEVGSISVTRVEGTNGLHVFISGNVLLQGGYVGAEINSSSPIFQEVNGLLEEGDLVLSEDGVILNVDGEIIYTQYLISADEV